jgi:hypothetical protein
MRELRRPEEGRMTAAAGPREEGVKQRKIGVGVN